ncbi:MAG TPA: hypothetical protein VN843_23355 [Anaerolineales bacterium]|nr:hypothetical protein [Anaerolineales bacterium]
MTIDINEAKVARNEIGMWLEWTLATAFGMLLGFLPSIVLVNIMDLALARLIVPLFAGFLVGLSQWVVLRKYVNKVSDWILAAGTSWAVGYALGLFMMNGLTGTGLDGFIGYILFGVIVALVQWPILRREIPNVWMWILANVVGWTAGFYLSQVSLDLLFDGPTIAPIASTSVLSGVSGLVAGAITGIALIWIVRKPERV